MLGVCIDISPTGTGPQVGALMLGVTLGLADGIEIHFFGMTVGIDFWPLALKLPTGRYGFQE